MELPYWWLFGHHVDYRDLPFWVFLDLYQGCTRGLDAVPVYITAL